MIRTITTLGAATLLMIAAACGGGGSSSSGGGGGTPTTPSPTPAPGGSATITITANGVSPRSVTIAAGQRVTFVNNDSRAHDMASDPHPAHTTCPAINDVGFLQPNQSRTTGNLTTARTCGYHDHNRDTDTSLQGSIVIQ
jgi:plastocyanin